MGTRHYALLRLRAAAVLTLSATTTTTFAYQIALTPPMGWSSWNKFACSINDADIKATAQILNSSGLLAAGYSYVNIDDCMVLPTRDAEGNLIPDPVVFPSGIGATADYVNSLNLKLGVYTDRGTETCAGRAGAYLHEAQDAAFYAANRVSYVKDDSCYAVDDPLTDYGAMQRGIDATGVVMVLSVEGEPPIVQWSQGGYGNMRRVGHDIQAHWQSAMSLVDIGSGLWMNTHNGSYNASQGGIWQDLDMMEVGQGDFVNGNPMSLMHFTMWCIMKAPLIIGADLTDMDSGTFAVLTNAAAIAVNQDALGVPARRVASITPSNTTLTAPFDIVATIATCNASKPTQEWHFRNMTSPTRNLLYLAACDASDLFQTWSFAGSNGTPSHLVNLGTGQCIDSSGQFDPGMLLPCDNSTTSQQWSCNATSNHVQSGSPRHCLDVYDFSGPDVEMGSCKVPGDQDSNQQWAWNASTSQLSSLSTGAPGMCLSAQYGPEGGQFYTVDGTGVEWCLDSGFNGEGGWTGSPCALTGGKSQIYDVAPVNGQFGNFTITGISPPSWNSQFGASGPLPHTRYITGWSWASASTWVLDYPSFVNGSGSSIQAAANDIANDNQVGNVTIGGDFCLDLSTMGNLEVWAGPLTGGRYAVALSNRSPGDDTITLAWEMMGVPAGASFSVFDIWQGVTVGTFTGAYTTPVVSHGVAFLVLTPSSA